MTFYGLILEVRETIFIISSAKSLAFRSPPIGARGYYEDRGLGKAQWEGFYGRERVREGWNGRECVEPAFENLFFFLSHAVFLTFLVHISTIIARLFIFKGIQ